MIIIYDFCAFIIKVYEKDRGVRNWRVNLAEFYIFGYKWMVNILL